MITRPVKKKLILINRDFQFRIAGAGLAASMIASMIMAVLIIYPLFQFKILTSIYFLPWPIVAGVVLAVVINMIVQLIFGIFLTHRIAGPMYGMIRTIRQIGAGQWNAQVRLRDSDELQMIGRHLNEMSEQLIRVSLEDLTKLDQISSAIANLEMDANGKEALNAKVAALKSDITKRIGPMKDRSENHD